MLRPLSLIAALCLAASAQADTVVVTQFNVSFSPADITINVGDTVRWERTGGVHDVTEGTDGTVDGDEAFFGLLDGPNPVFEFTFDSAFLAANPRPNNKYDYFCSPHFNFGMTGTVTVIDAPGTSFCDCPMAAAPCNNPGDPGKGCANSVGMGGELSATGSASALADDLAFNATGLRPGQPALLFSGLNQVNGGNGLTFGDGLRCAGASVVRLGISVPDSSGNSSWGPALGTAGGWNAGDTRRFQAWYRDPLTGPCATGFNLSNGYEVTFN
jgi:plastocyanin